MVSVHVLLKKTRRTSTGMSLKMIVIQLDELDFDTTTWSEDVHILRKMNPNNPNLLVV